jgi:hypothetical protein
MRTKERQLFLSTFELWCIALVSLALLIAGSAQVFLERYGLIGSSAEIHRQLTSQVSSGLSVLDSFTVTPAVVTFITWGLIGLVLFSVIQAAARASGIVRFERDLSSNRYVHPQNFDRATYWRRIVTDTLLSFVLLALLVAAAVMYVVFAVPVSFVYVQRFLLHVSLPHTLDLLAGLFTIFVGTTALYWLIKLAAWHHHLANR